MSDAAWVDVISTVVKIIVVVVLCIHVPPIMIWVERRGPALMQRRRGPNRVGLFKFRLWGLLQSLADALKLIFKEEIIPALANKKFFHLAPLIGAIPAFLIAGAIPFGPDIQLHGFTIPMSIINLDVGFLFILAISSLGVYSIALAGWACNSKYSLFGSLRASAQMVSYEIPLGLSLVPLVLIFGSLGINEIAQQQDSFLGWGIFLAPVSFFLFLISMFAETNRAPFDMAESEAELVAGFHTEYGSTKFALFFLAEYINMFVLSCLAATFFFGGWQLPFISQELLLNVLSNITQDYASLIASLLGMVTLLIKAAFFMWLFVWVRWTLPRFRYDQLMNLGWKFMLPLGLVNVLVTAVVLAALRF
ncbi:MAG: NADH-quinone oxidoreductase subunit NuoH [Oligoflexales bacterium]|nr:NADH-quinone oxidoreductase subunit NuoH [Oligoflexales bacterium]